MARSTRRTTNFLTPGEKGRWSADQVAGIREIGARVETALRAGHRWWDERWASWEPPSQWEPRAEANPDA